jgi:hypothetical protein
MRLSLMSTKARHGVEILGSTADRRAEHGNEM